MNPTTEPIYRLDISDTPAVVQAEFPYNPTVQRAYDSCLYSIVSGNPLDDKAVGVVVEATGMTPEEIHTEALNRLNGFFNPDTSEEG